MNEFIHDDFLLKTAPARRLFHECAARLPIINYHNHLDPGDLADDRRFESLTRLWIASDPYKHRAMQITGVPERFITGAATDREKFDARAAAVPLTPGNPLFHRTALELRRYFGIAEFLSPESADCIRSGCNERLGDSDYTAWGLIARADVECLCTFATL